MRLTLHNTKALNFSLNQLGVPSSENEVWIPEVSQELSDADSEKTSYELDLSLAFPEEPSDRYAVIFHFNLKLPSQALELSLSYAAEFKTDKPIPEEFKDSNFAWVNSPAIAFPYLRAFVSGFLLNAGYKPLILPSINFQALNEKKSK